MRREALGLLVEAFPDLARRALTDSLCDPNASVRATARFYLRSAGFTSFADVYREALERGARGTAAILRGLGETGGREDVDRVIPFLDGPGVAIRRAAVGALAALDGDNQVDRLVALLGDAFPGVSREARESLKHRAVTIGTERLWTLFETSRHLHVKRNAFALMETLSRWESLPCLVRACTAEDEVLARRAQIEVEGWLKGYGRQFFTRPTDHQLGRLDEALRSSRSHLSASTLAELKRLPAYR